jgi:hypothetical protein
MFLQLSFFVASVIFSAVFSLLTIPTPLHKAEWVISTNTYLVIPNSDILLSHDKWLDIQKDKTGQQKIIFDYFSSFITNLKLESLRTKNSEDINACFHGPSSKVIADINYFRDETTNALLLKIKVSATSSTRSDLEKCLKLVNEHYSNAFNAVFNINTAAYNALIKSLQDELISIKKFEDDYRILLRNKSQSPIIIDDNLLNFSSQFIKIIEKKSKLNLEIHFLDFKRKFFEETKVISELPKYSLTLDRNKIERFLIFLFSFFLILNIGYLISKILNLKITIFSKFSKTIISLFTRSLR